jgi:hypothetical protein
LRLARVEALGREQLAPRGRDLTGTLVALRQREAQLDDPRLLAHGRSQRLEGGLRRGRARCRGQVRVDRERVEPLRPGDLPAHGEAGREPGGHEQQDDDRRHGGRSRCGDSAREQRALAAGAAAAEQQEERQAAGGHGPEPVHRAVREPVRRAAEDGRRSRVPRACA